MSKERLEEAKKWLGQMRLILSTKTDKDEIAYVQSKIDLLEWLIEQVEQHKRYRGAITKTNGIWDDVHKQYKRDKSQYLDGMLDGLETALEVFSEALEESE